MKSKQFSTAKTKRYISTRRRISWFLSVLFILTQYGPQTLVMAAPQLFATPTAGVSRAPLGVARFNAPGFGDLEDAVNLATGNVYAAVEGVSRNNLTNTPSTPSPTNPGDETANSMGGKWQTTPRMRLYGFDSNLITENAPLSAYWLDYWARPNSVAYKFATSDVSGCGVNASGLIRAESIPVEGV